MIFPMIVEKLVAGVTAIIVAKMLFGKKRNSCIGLKIKEIKGIKKQKNYINDSIGGYMKDRTGKITGIIIFFIISFKFNGG